jgi:MYXO-CTERM domain-containing protein
MSACACSAPSRRCSEPHQRALLARPPPLGAKSRLNVALPPGDYDVGALADVGAGWQLDPSTVSSGNYSTTPQNPNFANYSSPFVSGHAGNNIGLRLYARIPECGDGFKDVTEERDDGNDDDNDACLQNCVTATCGDGIVWEGHEECDDGNDVDDDACSNACVAATCGDGIQQLDEECDDGNPTNDDACTNACTLPACGHGILQPGEECDDGNDQAGDGCALDCSVENDGNAGSGGKGGSGQGGSSQGGKGGSGQSGSSQGGKGGSGQSGKGQGESGESGAGDVGTGDIDDVREDSGCGCRLERRGGGEGLWAALGLGALAVARRRRR